MKKSIFAVIFCAVFSGPLHAESSSEDPCVTISRLAEKIMENRQAGIAMTDMMKIADSNELIRQMIIAAYEEPRFSSDKHQRNAVMDFRNQIELVCYKAP